MRILFIGSVEFSYHILKKLFELKADIVGICTLKESNLDTDHVDLSLITKKRKIPFIYSPDINNKDVIEWIKEKTPDIIFCFGWSKLLKQDLVNIAPLGVVGYHPSMLPENKGRHPIIWALALGLKSTGSSFFFMDLEADSGKIISQRKIQIDFSDDAQSLYTKVIETAKEQIEFFLPTLASGNVYGIPQDGSNSNVWRKRNYRDGIIDWRMSSESIYNLIRGLTRPYIGAEFLFGKNIIKVWSSKIEKCTLNNFEPGKVLDIKNKKILVKIGDGAIWLLDIGPFPDVNLGDYL